MNVAYHTYDTSFHQQSNNKAKASEMSLIRTVYLIPELKWVKKIFFNFFSQKRFVLDSVESRITELSLCGQAN